MEDRETARMHKYGVSKTTRIMMATVPHVTSGLEQKISGRWIFVDTSVKRRLPLPVHGVWWSIYWPTIFCTFKITNGSGRVVSQS